VGTALRAALTKLTVVHSSEKRYKNTVVLYQEISEGKISMGFSPQNKAGAAVGRGSI